MSKTAQQEVAADFLKKWGYVPMANSLYTAMTLPEVFQVIGPPGSGKSTFVEDLMDAKGIEHKKVVLGH